MKKTLLFLMLTVVGGVAFAGGIDNPTASNRMAVVRSGALFKVFYKGAAMNRVTVNIYDASGVKVFADNLGRVDNFVRAYNFSSLSEGAYSIELVDALGKQVEEVSYHPTSTEKVARLLRLKNGDSRFLLMVPAQEKGNVHIKIFDRSQKVVHEETVETAGDFSKIYDLKALSGDFTFEVKQDKADIRVMVN